MDYVIKEIHTNWTDEEHICFEIEICDMDEKQKDQILEVLVPMVAAERACNTELPKEELGNRIKPFSPEDLGYGNL